VGSSATLSGSARSGHLVAPDIAHWVHLDGRPEAMTCVARAGVIAGQKLRVQLPNAVSGRAGAYWRRVAIAVPYLGPGRPLAWLGGIELPAAAV